MASIVDCLKEFQKKERTSLFEPIPNFREALHAIGEKYGTDIPDTLVNLYSETSGGFVEVYRHECWRILTPSEILEAEDDLNTDFVNVGLMPVIDCKENNFICYKYRGEMAYVIFNIVDGARFDERSFLGDFLRPFLEQ